MSNNTMGSNQPKETVDKDLHYAFIIGGYGK
jgi:hypothetical protein